MWLSDCDFEIIWVDCNKRLPVTGENVPLCFYCKDLQRYKEPVYGYLEIDFYTGKNIWKDEYGIPFKDNPTYWRCRERKLIKQIISSMSVEDLVAISCVSKSSVYRWRRGGNISKRNIENIFSALGIT